MPGNLPLTDRFMPFPDATERHSILIPASRDRIWYAIKHPDPADIRFAKPLFALRDLVSRLRNGHGQLDLPTFATLAEDPGREMVDGVIGQWWRLGRAENVSSVTDADSFLAFDRPGFAKATFSFFLEDGDDGCVRLVTETRIQATSPEARQAFLRYWLLIRLGSGFVRRVMLSAIRTRALKAGD